MPASTPALAPAVASRVDALIAELTAVAGPANRGPAPLVSVWLGDLAGATLLAVAEDEPHYAASTMKLPLLLAAYRLHDQGVLDLSTEVVVRNDFASAADGSSFSLDQSDDQDDDTWDAIGSPRTLRWLAEHATVRSGNLATNLLLERVGTTAVAEVLADAGCSPTTVLPRGIEDAAAHAAGLDNVVTAADLGLVMRGVGAGTIAGPAASAEVEAVLARQEHRDGIPAGLPTGTYVANKTGWVEAVSHDVALVRPDGRAPYVLVVLTSVDVPEETASSFIADVSRSVWKGWQA